jgi:hypothetical protein
VGPPPLVPRGEQKAHFNKFFTFVQSWNFAELSETLGSVRILMRTLREQQKGNLTGLKHQKQILTQNNTTTTKLNMLILIFKYKGYLNNRLVN